MISLKAWFQPWTIVRLPPAAGEKGGRDVVYLTMGESFWIPAGALPDVREERLDDSDETTR